MSVNPAIFDPFKDVLADGERLRLKDGVLTVENRDVRSTQMSGWTRFWTRGQYSQSAILKEMGKLYKQAQNNLGEDEQRDTFIKNFATLEGRATAQNEKFKDVSSIVRFFEAKSFIDVASFHKKFQKIDDAIIQAVNDKRQAAARIARAEQQANFDAQAKPITDKLELLNEQLANLQNTTLDDYNQRAYDIMIADGVFPEMAKSLNDRHGKNCYDSEINSLKMMIATEESALKNLQDELGL